MAIPVLPPSAPFTSEQRAYLNGFFAGLFGLEGSTSGHHGVAAPTITAELNSPSHNAALPNGSLSSPAQLNGDGVSLDINLVDESTPWHDASLSLDERMELAKDRPLPQKYMAAMAQLDCGQCGYLCKTYAAAIADGSEKSLRKCVPGGKETANKLKELVASA